MKQRKLFGVLLTGAMTVGTIIAYRLFNDRATIFGVEAEKTLFTRTLDVQTARAARKHRKWAQSKLTI